jgi:non-canonical poly(A) RNA polymerase PAPD5/7
MDFYCYVKPRDFEQFIRTKVVEELRAKVRQNFAKDADIRTFGSFPAGLYLPTADMDLVCVSDEYMKGGRPRFGTKSAIHKFAAFLDRQNLALPGSKELILGAKVPLVKYVDRLTGLKIDISFENNTGLVANKTFQNWKHEFPAMPIRVTLIKHLLAMRGLNEPVNGGIGGFSVTCLVVSLLQNMPQVQSRSMVPEHHLGEILMEFLDLYGNQFNTQTTAVQFDPPGYVSKVRNLFQYLVFAIC